MPPRGKSSEPEVKTEVIVVEDPVPEETCNNFLSTYGVI